MGVKGSDIRISKDDGIQAWPTIVSLAESPKRAGLLYAGTDDGNVQVTRDAGKTWSNITAKIPNLPKGVWVSELVPSRFDEATVYATFDDHRQNDFGTYVFASRDYGQTWQPAVSGDLNGQVVKTLTEDAKNPDVLYVGTETGLFVHARSREGLDAHQGEPARRARRRDHDPAARQRDDPRDARARALDPRSPRADPGVRGDRGRRRRREALLDGAVGDVPASGARPQLRVLGQPDVLRREPAGRRRSSRGWTRKRSAT